MVLGGFFGGLMPLGSLCLYAAACLVLRFSGLLCLLFVVGVIYHLHLCGFLDGIWFLRLVWGFGFCFVFGASGLGLRLW